MAIALTSAQQSRLDAARNWSMTHLHPYAQQWEATATFPRQAFEQAAKDGYVGLVSSHQHGGQDCSYIDSFLTYEGMAYGDPAVCTYLHIFNCLLSQLEHWYTPSPELLALLPDFMTGKKFMAFSLSELTAGSDASATKSTCHFDGTHYILNGDKAWVSNSENDDYYMVTAHNLDGQGMVMVLVPRDAQGLTVDGNPHRIAGNAISCGQLHFQDCRVPESHLLSGQGLRSALSAIDVARLNASAVSLGLAQRALDITIDYVSKRETFGVTVLSNQAIQFQLAQLQTEIAATRWLAYHTAAQMDETGKGGELAAMSKLKATSTAVEVTRTCIRLFGASGLCSDSEIARLTHFAHVLEITDGTNEIQKMVIGRGIAKRASQQ